jgi:hypothetical protein
MKKLFAMAVDATSVKQGFLKHSPWWRQDEQPRVSFDPAAKAVFW